MWERFTDVINQGNQQFMGVGWISFFITYEMWDPLNEGSRGVSCAWLLEFPYAQQEFVLWHTHNPTGLPVHTHNPTGLPVRSQGCTYNPTGLPVRSESPPRALRDPPFIQCLVTVLCFYIIFLTRDSTAQRVCLPGAGFNPPNFLSSCGLPVSCCQIHSGFGGWIELIKRRTQQQPSPNKVRRTTQINKASI